MDNADLIRALEAIETHAAEHKDPHLFELAQLISGSLMTDSLTDIHDTATRSLITTLTRIIAKEGK